MRKRIFPVFVIGLCTSWSLTHAASWHTREEEELARAYGDEELISIATGARQLISQAPAVASVITAEDIRAIGATDLDQILATVPGLHVSVSPRAYSPLYTVRGIYSENNPQVLVLVNDIPITNVYVGDRSQVWGGMPVNNIARIEVIRGPGSALYGADAFAGTINIITKKADDIDGTETGVRGGTFNTAEGWLLHGGQWKGFDVAFSLELMTTDGQDSVILQDAQTGFDLLGTTASLAPGTVNLERKSIETRLDVSRGPWRLRLGYQGRDDVGTGAGAALALDPEGSGTAQRYNADLTYNSTLLRDWDITGQLSYFDTSTETDLTLYPAGAFGFDDGVIGSPQVYERHTRAGLSAFFHGFEHHKVRVGIGGAYSDMYKVREFKNFTQLDPALPPVPLTAGQDVVDVSSDPNQVFIQPQDRTVFYTFVQDEWSVLPNWKLTGGVRYDRYSDFGDTVNPRLALVWQTSYSLTTKLLYGRAFRAPAFNELYNINNPLALGNSGLKPETIDTYEIAINHRSTSRLETGVNLFHYVMADVIRFEPATGIAENSGGIKGLGFEIEANYDVSEALRLTGNYAFQRSEDDESKAVIANAPRNQLYLRGGWKPLIDWLVNVQLTWIADRARDTADPRPAIDDYLITDMTLRYRPVARSWEIAASVRNLFDEDAREPSPRLLPLPGSVPMIPDDLPLAGRHFFVEARYRF